MWAAPRPGNTFTQLTILLHSPPSLPLSRLASPRFVTFCLSRVELLLKHGIKPLLVFDGASLSIKRGENAERRRQREEARTKAFAAHAKGDLATARAFYSRAVSVSHQMAHQLVAALKEKNIPFLVAPYEADSQLAYLSRNSLVDLVITEDGDSLVLGCKRVLFKLDLDGNGIEACLRNLGASTDLSFVNWSPDMFMDMCLLSGCDYVPSIPGLGMKTAHRVVREHRTPKRILEALRRSKFQLPADFTEAFWQARAAFRHMRVYDPRTRSCVSLTPETEAVVDRFPGGLDFLGPVLPSNIAQLVAGGFVHPKTYQPWPVTTVATVSRSASRSALPRTGALGPGSEVAHGGSTATGNEESVAAYSDQTTLVEISTTESVAAALAAAGTCFDERFDAAAAAYAAHGVPQRGRREGGDDGDDDDDNEEEQEMDAEENARRGLQLSFRGRQGLLHSADFRSPAISDAIEIMHRGRSKAAAVTPFGASPRRRGDAAASTYREHLYAHDNVPPGYQAADYDEGHNRFNDCMGGHDAAAGHTKPRGECFGRHGRFPQEVSSYRKRPAPGASPSPQRSVAERNDRLAHDNDDNDDDDGEDEEEEEEEVSCLVNVDRIQASVLPGSCGSGWPGISSQPASSRASQESLASQQLWDNGLSRQCPLPTDDQERGGTAPSIDAHRLMYCGHMSDAPHSESTFRGCQFRFHGSSAYPRFGDCVYTGPSARDIINQRAGTSGQLLQTAFSFASTGQMSWAPFMQRSEFAPATASFAAPTTEASAVVPAAGGTPFDFEARLRHTDQLLHGPNRCDPGPDYGRPFFPAR